MVLHRLSDTVTRLSRCLAGELAEGFWVEARGNQWLAWHRLITVRLIGLLIGLLIALVVLAACGDGDP